MPGEEQFFNKLGEIPVLNDGWTTALGYYGFVKDYNSLTKFTLNVAESGVKTAANISSPLLNRYQPQILSVNDYACNKLEEIENKYPLLKQPSDEVKDACLEYAEPILGRVKPVVTYVNGAVDNSRKRINGIKRCSSNLVEGACTYSVGTVHQAVNMTLNSPPARLVTRTVHSVLSSADDLVEKYIPEEQQEENDTSSDSTEDGGSPSTEKADPIKGVEQMELMEPTPERVVVHFKSVSNKLRRRMFQRAMKDFKGAKLRTMDAINKLHSTVDLIDYAKTNMNAAQAKLEDLWGQITDSSEKQDMVTNEDVSAGSVEKSVVNIGRILVGRVKEGIAAVEKAYNEAGQIVRHPITKTKEYTDFLYHFTMDITSMSIEKARLNLSQIQKRLQEMIDNFESPEWLSMDIEMQGIDLEEEDLGTESSDEETEIPRPENHL